MPKFVVFNANLIHWRLHRLGTQTRDGFLLRDFAKATTPASNFHFVIHSVYIFYSFLEAQPSSAVTRRIDCIDRG
jgi:hypothetical protein